MNHPEAVTEAIEEQIAAFHPDGPASVKKLMSAAEEIPRALQAAYARLADTLGDEHATQMPMTQALIQMLHDHAQTYATAADHAADLAQTFTTDHAGWLADG